MQKRLVLLLVFVCILFLFINQGGIHEGFRVATDIVKPKVPITAKYVKQMLDDVILTTVKEYQTLTEMKSQDIRVQNSMKALAIDINQMNQDYPTIEDTIQGFPFESVSMISEDDIKILKDFIVRTAGQVDPQKPLEPVTVADIDLFINRLLSLSLLIQNKTKLLPNEIKEGIRTIQTSFETTVAEVIKNTRELKQSLGSMKPANIPVLKRFSYVYVFMLAQSKYVWSPEVTNKPTGPIQTHNLPLPKSAIQELKDTLQQQNAVALPSATPSICPPQAKACPVPPKGKKYSETVRDLLIENALVKAYGGTYLYG